MASSLSPSKVLLLAVHFAILADTDCLSAMLERYPLILHNDLLLRILLTHLPETVESSAYIGLLQQFVNRHHEASDETPGLGATFHQIDVNTSVVDELSEEEASKKAKKLRLLSLASPEMQYDANEDSVTLFLFHRALRVDQEAGMLAQLPGLLMPFLDHSPQIRTWTLSTVLPFLRRNVQYYPGDPNQLSLCEFQQLSDRAAVAYLLSRSGTDETEDVFVSRDLRGLVGPWLRNEARWQWNEHQTESADSETAAQLSCPGWDFFLEWLIAQSTKSWKIAVDAVEQWAGANDVDLPDPDKAAPLTRAQQQYLQTTFLKAAFGSTYVIGDPSLPAMSAAYRISNKIATFLSGGPSLSIDVAVLNPPVDFNPSTIMQHAAKATGYLRNELLSASNILTKPDATSLILLRCFILSAYISCNYGVPYTIRNAADLTFIQDRREQIAEFTRLLRAISSHMKRNSDEHWIQARRELLWLQSWAPTDSADAPEIGRGMLGMVPKVHIEVELLKALLSNSRYSLARELYENTPREVLPLGTIQEAVQESALNAFDNSTNPNRTRGGLKRCDEIIHAFPKTLTESSPERKRIEALIKATHALSEYRLVLKQGELFSPVVIRVHSDPVSIIGKVLEQNPGAYTRLSEFLEMGISMVLAGLPIRSDTGRLSAPALCDQDSKMSIVEKRIVSMCIEAALREDDFETAYSYVVSRLAPTSIGSEQEDHISALDEWSWSAALLAGQYIRTDKSQQPTHLGTSSGNLEIRHLEQRIECLATALRVAPAAQLQEILKTFRRCEEQLDSAIKEEAAKEATWDAAGDLSDLPGAFNNTDTHNSRPPRNLTATVAARQTEEAPMSLFDLSRATARVAQRNFSALSSLQGVAQGFTQSTNAAAAAAATTTTTTITDEQSPQRVRKRDQFREAATGTLVSGVGWLIGANVNRDG